MQKIKPKNQTKSEYGVCVWKCNFEGWGGCVGVVEERVIKYESKFIFQKQYIYTVKLV